MKTKTKRTKKKEGEVLVLRDANGDPRIIMSAANVERPFVSLIGKDGSGMIFEINGLLPRIILKRRGGTPGITILLNGSGSQITQTDAKNRPAIFSSVDPVSGQTEFVVMSDGQPCCIMQGTKIKPEK